MTTHADIQKAKGLLAVLKKQAQQVGAPNPLPAE
jgi:hypothetical protein